MRQGEGPTTSQDTLWRAQQEVYSDPWDGRPDRMRHFVATLRERCPAAELKDGRIWIAKLVVTCGFAKSNGEAKRLVKQGGVSIDGDAISDESSDLEITDGMLLKVGKRRFARIYNG